MKFLIKFEKPKYNPSDRSGVEYFFSYSLVDKIYLDEPEEDFETKHYYIKVAISDYVLFNWKLEHNEDLVKILFEYGKRYIEDKINKHSLKQKEELTILTNNSPDRCPFNPKRIAEPEGYTNDIEILDKQKNMNNYSETKTVDEIYDVFICHASEDKQKIAAPIFEDLTKCDLKIFLDEKYIKWGDSFIEKINHALGTAKYVIAILSLNSVEKAWPVKEINASLAKEISGKQKLLPLMVGTNKEIEIFHKKMPLLGDKKYLRWENNTSKIVESIRDLMST
jgi:TIR domain-containing protein